MFNLNSWSKAEPLCLVPYPKAIASLKLPCLGLQKATFIYPVWPDGLGDPGDRL